MGLRNTIKNVLREMTETDPLWWVVPDKYVDMLGIKLYRPQDIVYILEIQFDTRRVVFGLYDSDTDLSYDQDPDVPSTYDGEFTMSIDELPFELINFIRRRLKSEYIKALQ
jgi:hypothetical protein